MIVRNGRVVGEGWNQVTSHNDPTAHAEMVAIRAAATAIGDYRLEGCEIFTSCEPCPMCLAALYWSRIDRLFFGGSSDDTTKIGFSDEFQYDDFKLPWDQRKGIAVSPGFEREVGLTAYTAWTNKKDRHYY